MGGGVDACFAPIISVFQTTFSVPADPDRIIAAHFDHICWFCFVNVAFVGQMLLNRLRRRNIGIKTKVDRAFYFPSLPNASKGERPECPDGNKLRPPPPRSGEATCLTIKHQDYSAVAVSRALKLVASKPAQCCHNDKQ